MVSPSHEAKSVETESEALRWASVALTVIPGEPLRPSLRGFDLGFSGGFGVGLSATPTPGDADCRPRYPVDLGL